MHDCACLSEHLEGKDMNRQESLYLDICNLISSEHEIMTIKYWLGSRRLLLAASQ